MTWYTAFCGILLLCSPPGFNGFRSPMMMRGSRGAKKARLGKSLGGAEEAPSPPSAPRVSSDSSLGVRKQIKLVRALKQMQNSDSGPIERTSFRNKKDVDGYSRAPKEADGGFRKVNVTYVKQLVVVDGYNCVGQWPGLRKMVRQSNSPSSELAQARRTVTAALERLAANRHWEVLIVWDATGARGTGAKGKPRSSVGCDYEDVSKDVRAVFTRAETADSHIEKLVYDTHLLEARREVTVVTNDRLLRLHTAAQGATLMSTESLIEAAAGERARLDLLMEARRSAAAIDARHALRTEAATGAPADAAVVPPGQRRRNQSRRRRALGS